MAVGCNCWDCHTGRGRDYLGHPNNPYQSDTYYVYPVTTTANPNWKPPNIYSNPLPPWPTPEEIRKIVREELKKLNGRDS